MDAFLEGGDNEIEVDITPNIEFQLDKYNEKEYISWKQIPEKSLFISTILKKKLINFYENNLDIPILIHGLPGSGKLTNILGLIIKVPGYFPSITENKETDTRLINNLLYLKIQDNTFPKLLCYENLYFLNINILNNITEVSSYLKHVHRTAKSRSIDNSRKIFIITHIEKCNREAQRYITFMLDKINSNTSYIFTTTNLNIIDRKIISSCAKIYGNYMNEPEFSEIFTFNYSKTGLFENSQLTPFYMKYYYEIYKNNNYNIGNTISQIKFLIYTCDEKKPFSLETLHEPTQTKSLLNNIVINFIKKRLKLSNVNQALEIRKTLYTLCSINIDLLEFTKLLVSELLHNKLTNHTKELIIQKAGELSRELTFINKEVISIESFLFKLIYIIYSGGYDC